MHLVWMILDDGRSLVAGCGPDSREGLERALADPSSLLALTSDDRVDLVPTSAVREFVLCDVDSRIPEASVVYRSFTLDQ